MKIFVLVVIVGFLTGWLFLLTRMDSGELVGQDAGSRTKPGEFEFRNPKKSAHYESNTPAHAAVLVGVPVNVVVDFNFDLAESSEIRIFKDGADYGAGETVVDSGKLSMRRAMRPEVPDGLYTVEYTACWPDGSCHGGNFQFGIDRSLGKEFSDLTDQEDVVIRLSQIKFVPENVKVKRGATVTWINDDDVEHYVNTDSHPAHTYYPAQNSKALRQGERFSTVFNQAGAYPYHCSAHASVMRGILLVE